MSNHLTLIDQVGGIEKVKMIVEGAPEGATDFLHDTYFKMVNPVEWYYWEECQWKFTSYDDRFKNLLVSINDLRTAIAQHEQGSNSSEFKVGDLVVLKQSHSQDKVLKIQMFYDDFIRAFADSKNYSFGHKINFRHATPSEIKAGRRLDHSVDVTDMVTDIRNHISQNTKVINHG